MSPVTTPTLARATGPARWLAALTLGCLAGAPLAYAQDASSRADLPAPEPPPELRSTDQQKVGRAFKKLTSRKDAARRAAMDDILAFGRGAVPMLVEEADTTSEAKRSSLTHCLLALTDMRDWDLVESQVQSPLLALRRFAARKAGELALVHLTDELLELLDDEDGEVRLESAIAVTALGDEAGLSALVDAHLPIFREELLSRDPKAKRAVDPTHADQGARILAALPRLADVGLHQTLSSRLAIDPKRVREDPEGAAIERQAAIAMLRALGDRASRQALTKALDDPHNLVQRDAINALRQLLEDKSAFAGGSIFQQIEEVNRLKKIVQTSSR
jgi:HEAT repeat protein